MAKQPRFDRSASSSTRQVRAVLRDLPVRNELLNALDAGRSFAAARKLKVSNAMMKAVVGPEGKGPPPAAPPRPYSEAVVTAIGRPPLLVRGGTFEMPELLELRRRLAPRRKYIERYIPSVGRIEVKNLPQAANGYVGTGWMIGERTVVTNRHVAEKFAALSGTKIIDLRNFLGEPIERNIDFREEYEGRESFEVGIDKVLFLEKSSNQAPDVAFLRLSAESNLPEPIPVASKKVVNEQDVVVIGYPAYDPIGGGDPQILTQLFGDIYNVKRLSPGRVIHPGKDWYFLHDATTLGGSSGSVVLDLRSQNAVGLHFQGQYQSANFAVDAATVLNRLGKLKVAIVKPRDDRAAAAQPAIEAELSGEPEATPQSYADRKGFQEDFIGNTVGLRVPFPKARTKAKKDDVLKVAGPGISDNVLHYTNFSVQMSASRRLCLWSAVNINGEESVSIKGRRPGWRFDGRFSTAKQIKGECYGEESEGKFSRGHMTRREDPNWGPMAQAKKANTDTFHVTNACPQFQPFNAGVWLGLEDYALENARQDDMRISVMTGPIFEDEDPEFFGVRVPVEFWKIIAFIHDDTGKLSATGYRISQQSALPGREFVFGAYETHQVPIHYIETRTGLSFGKLKDLDPLKVMPESSAAPLVSLRDIVF